MGLIFVAPASRRLSCGVRPKSGQEPAMKRPGQGDGNEGGIGEGKMALATAGGTPALPAGAT